MFVREILSSLYSSGEYREKLEIIPHDDGVTDLVLRRTGDKVRVEVTDTAAATDEEAARIYIGELKELLALQGLNEEDIKRVLAGEPFWGTSEP
jgi:hypothetical protein